MVEPRGGARIHADGDKIEPSIEVEIAKGMRHAEEARFADPFGSHIAEVAMAIVAIEIDAAKIAHHQQVESAVIVEVDQRAAISPPVPLPPEAALDRGVPKMPRAVVEQKETREAIIRVVIRVWHFARDRGHAVLGQPDVQVPVAVDVPRREDLRVAQPLRGRPDPQSRAGKMSLPI